MEQYNRYYDEWESEYAEWENGEEDEDGYRGDPPEEPEEPNSENYYMDYYIFRNLDQALSKVTGESGSALKKELGRIVISAYAQSE